MATADEPTDDPLREPGTLARYAQAIVGTCLGIAPNDLLVVRGEPAHRELMVALAEAGYRAGARHVEAWYADPRVRRARIALAGDEFLGSLQRWDAERYRACIGADAALVSITGEESPDLLADLPAERVADDFRRPSRRLRWFMRAQSEERVRFCVAAWPTERWAAQVYGDLPPAEGRARLAHDLLRFCRLGPDDDADAWARHVEKLVARAAALSERPLRRLEFRGPGVELDVGLAPGTRFLTAADENAYGQRPCVNFPTEEVYTSPDPAAVDGVFRCSRPLSMAGRLIDGIGGEFRGGRLVRLEAAAADDRDMLARYLDTDRGARRLGEVALVDRESRIGQTGRVYNDTLIDENAASHIAFGFGFRYARAEADGRPVNESRIHLDVMVGSDDVDVAAVEEGGARLPLLGGGAWQLAA